MAERIAKGMTLALLAGCALLLMAVLLEPAPSGGETGEWEPATPAAASTAAADPGEEKPAGVFTDHVHERYQACKRTPPAQRTELQWHMILSYEENHDSLKHLQATGDGLSPTRLTDLHRSAEQVMKFDRDPLPPAFRPPPRF